LWSWTLREWSFMCALLSNGPIIAL
jgi:hypothetical protein